MGDRVTIRSMYVYNGATWDEVGFTVAHDVPAGGTTGQLLAKASATDYDTSWLAQSALTVAPTQVTGTALVATTADAKGDLLVASAADTVGRLAVGTDGAGLVASSAASSGVAWSTRGAQIAVGDYWIPGTYDTAITATATQGFTTYDPIYVPHTMTISEVRIQVGTGAAAGALWRLGLFSPASPDNKPGAVLADLGTVDPTGTGTKAITGLSVVLPAGLLYVAYALQGSGAGGGTFFYGTKNGVHHPVIPSALGPFSSYGHSQTQTGVTGAFATAAPTSASTGMVPLMNFKRSA